MPKREHNDELPKHVSQLAQMPTSSETSSLEPLLIPAEFRLRENTSGFNPGSIIFLQLKNFQIAESALYKFEPSFNLILGGNGTGKSAIINAIFLLFLGNIESLKQTNYSAFIQHGKETSQVSCLFQSIGDENVELAMVLTRYESTAFRRKIAPQWYLNGNEIDVETCFDLLKQYKINVNNLCQFLPQFRVAAFSGETSNQRLISTIEAVGYDGMAEDYQYLASNSSDLSAIEDELSHLLPEIEALKKRKQELETDLQLMKEQEKNMLELEILENVVVVKKYLSINDKRQELKNQVKTAKEKLKQIDNLTKKNAKHNREITTKISSINSELNMLSSSLSQHQMQIDKFNQTLSKLNGEIKDGKTYLNAEITKLRGQLTEQKQLTGQLTEEKITLKSLEQKINKSSLDKETFLLKFNELETAQQKFSNINNSLHKRNQQLSVLEVKLADAKAQQIRINHSLQNLKTNNLKVSQLHKVLPNDRGSIQSCLNLCESRKQHFKGEIISPAILSVEITNVNVRNLLSTVLPADSVQRFVCLEAVDQQVLDNLMKQVPRARPMVTHVKDTPQNLFNSIDELKELKFDGVIIDNLRGPDGMMKYFKTLQLHNIPYSLNRLTPSQVDNVKQFFTKKNINQMRFADSEFIYQLRRSKYGQRNVVLTTRRVQTRPHEYINFMLQTNNHLKINELKSSLTKQKDLEQSFGDQIAKLESEISEMEQQLPPLSEQTAKLQFVLDEKKLRDRHKVKLRLVEKLESEINKKKDKINQDKIGELLINLKTKIRKLHSLNANQPYQLLEPYSKSVPQKDILMLVKKDESLQQSALEQVLLLFKEKATANLSECQQALNEFNTQTRELNEQYNHAVAFLRQQSEQIYNESIEKAQQQPLSELEQEYKQQQARLSLRRSANSLETTEANLERTNLELEKLTEKLEEQHQTQQTLNSNITEVKDKFITHLDEMIELVNLKFTSMFSTTNCRGEVRLSKPNRVSIGTWGIDINVAFRPEEPLTPLSRQRQSGGERAITTAFYLMSLQDQANSPFRVLDEINQGMDEQNERITMKFLIDFSCNTNKQYFLVTPKLIPNIHTNEKMHVVFILGGTAVGDCGGLVPSWQQN